MTMFSDTARAPCRARSVPRVDQVARAAQCWKNQQDGKSHPSQQRHCSGDSLPEPHQRPRRGRQLRFKHGAHTRNFPRKPNSPRGKYSSATINRMKP
jgi:hypothetical protein